MEAIMGLGEFTRAVNLISEAHCERLNASYRAGKLLFGAKHHDYSESMIDLYWRQGVSPEQAFKAICDDAG